MKKSSLYFHKPKRRVGIFPKKEEHIDIEDNDINLIKEYQEKQDNFIKSEIL